MTVSDFGFIFLAALPVIVVLSYYAEIAGYVRRLIGRDRALHVVRPRMNSAEIVMDRERRRREGVEAIRTYARRSR